MGWQPSYESGLNSLTGSKSRARRRNKRVLLLFYYISVGSIFSLAIQFQFENSFEVAYWDTSEQLLVKIYPLKVPPSNFSNFAKEVCSPPLYRTSMDRDILLIKAAPIHTPTYHKFNVV